MREHVHTVCVCVCVCACVPVRVCVHACVRACVCVRENHMVKKGGRGTERASQTARAGMTNPFMPVPCQLSEYKH